MMDRPPGPPENFLLGSLLEFRRDPLALLQGLRERQGDVTRFRLVRDVCYLFAHPDHVRHILRDNSTNYRKALFFDKLKVMLGDGLLSWAFEDDFWRQRRRLVAAPFRPRSIAQVADLWAQATEALAERWRPRADSGEYLDAFAEMMAHSLDLSARVFLSIDAKTEDAETAADALSVCLEHLMHKVGAPVDLPEWIPTKRNRSLRAALGALDRLIYGRIEARRRAGAAAPDDFLTRFIRANDEPGSRVSDRLLRDELMTLFLAGFETNASALAWTLWLLARHSEYAEEVAKELREVLGDRPPSYDAIARLSLTRMVLDESMRLFPPAWWMARAALGDDEIGGYAVPKGVTVIVSPWVTHRHPAFWADPDRFDPRRFSPERSLGRPPLAFFPFGDGPRGCVAESFARVQVLIVLAALLRRFRVIAKPGHEVTLLPVITSRPREPVWIRLEPRSDRHSDT